VIDTPQAELAPAGLKVAVYPVQSLFIAYKAVRDMMKELKATGTIANWAQRTPAWEKFNTFIGANESTDLAKRYRIVCTLPAKLVDFHISRLFWCSRRSEHVVASA